MKTTNPKKIYGTLKLVTTLTFTQHVRIISAPTTSSMLVFGHSSTTDDQRVCVGCGPCKGDVDGHISSGRGHMPCHRPYAHTGPAIQSSRGLWRAREGLTGLARHILLYDPRRSHIIGQVYFKFVHIIHCH